MEELNILLQGVLQLGNTKTFNGGTEHMLQGVLQLGNTKTLNEGTEHIATGCAAARQYQNF